MWERYKRYFIFPIIVIVISGYAVIMNIYNRADRVDNLNKLPDKYYIYNSEQRRSYSSDGKININTAGVEELTLLREIGEKTAENIIEYRNNAGGFKSIEEILNVKGIGEKTFERLKNYISVE